MKAVTYQGSKNVEVKNVKDPQIKNSDDIIIKVTVRQFAAPICICFIR